MSNENNEGVAVASDLESRVKSFNEKLLPLLAEFELGLGATPVITNDGRIGARPNIFDDRKKKESEEAVTDKPEVSKEGAEVSSEVEPVKEA